MRAIHHDGRVGECCTNLRRLRKDWEVRFWFGVAPLTYERVKAGDLRPIGPIEQGLRRDVGVPWSDLTVDWASEAIEACARIWEQHGVAL